jgi:hypothetical protein
MNGFIGGGVPVPDMIPIPIQDRSVKMDANKNSVRGRVSWENGDQKRSPKRCKCMAMVVRGQDGAWPGWCLARMVLGQGHAGLPRQGGACGVGVRSILPIESFCSNQHTTPPFIYTTF